MDAEGALLLAPSSANPLIEAPRTRYWFPMPGRPRRRELRAYRRRLESYDPDERTAAASELAERGLTRRSATVITRGLKDEEDRRVRFEIALTIARTNGGRSRRARVRALRRWAVDELLEHGHPVHKRLEQQRGRKRPLLAWQAPAPQTQSTDHVPEP